MSNDKDALNLLAELDAEFGKKPKAKGNPAARKSNGSLQDAASQLARTQFTSYGDWELYRLMHEANDAAKHMDMRPSWIPEARLTYVVTQYCDTCGDKVSFIGGEYVRFRSVRERATITRRAEVCTDIFHYGKFRETDVPEYVEELHQTVARCPGCIKVEQMAADLWHAATEKQPEQQEIEL